MTAQKGLVSKKLQAFGYGDVVVREGEFGRAFEECYRYYLNLSVDDMLFELRKKVGIQNPGGAKSLAEEKGSWFGLGGNVLGQWLQAYARFYAVTRRSEAREKACALVRGLREIALYDDELGDGLFMYFFEKYLRGFLDCYELCGEPDALVLARSFVGKAMRSPVYRDAKRRLGDNGTPPHPVEIEWYTISESLNRFADVYEREKGDGAFSDEVRVFAKKFEYRRFWDIFYQKRNLFDYSPLAGQNTAYFHSYSHLNSFNSAAYLYDMTGDRYYLDSILRFYAFMREKQELITGGYGPHLEWLMPRTGIVHALKNYHDSFETQCCSYAVYRIGRWLTAFTGEAQYGDWSEKLLYNATLASVPMDEGGHVQYYSDLNVCGASKYLHENSWTCCTGTRPLLFCELHRCIYFHDGDDLYVNLFVPSCLEHAGMRVSLQGEYPRGNAVELHLLASDGRRRKIAFRIPEHAATVSLKLNGKDVHRVEQNGWLSAEGEFQAGDVLRIEIESRLVWSTIACMGEGVTGLRCGAVVLATSSAAEEVAACLDFSKPAAEQFEQIGVMEYKTKKGNVLFRPYMDYKKGERYFIYFENEEESA